MALHAVTLPTLHRSSTTLTSLLLQFHWPSCATWTQETHFVRKALVLGCPFAWMTLVPYFPVFHIHFFQLLAETSVIQTGLFLPLYYKQHPSFCPLTIIYVCFYQISDRIFFCLSLYLPQQWIFCMDLSCAHYCEKNNVWIILEVHIMTE